MKNIVLIIILIILADKTAYASSKIYEIKLRSNQNGPRLLSLIFHRKVFSPKVVDKLLYQALRLAVSINSTRDILAMAFVDDTTMTLNQYSGALIFVAKRKKIITMDEYDGIKKSSISSTRYYVAIAEKKTYIMPRKHWLSVSLVYPAKLSRTIMYKDMVSVISELASKNKDINIYTFIGDKAKRSSWFQVEDYDGAYIFCKYDAESKKITRKSKLISIITSPSILKKNTKIVTHSYSPISVSYCCPSSEFQLPREPNWKKRESLLRILSRGSFFSPKLGASGKIKLINGEIIYGNFAGLTKQIVRIRINNHVVIGFRRNQLAPISRRVFFEKDFIEYNADLEVNEEKIIYNQKLAQFNYDNQSYKENSYEVANSEYVQ